MTYKLANPDTFTGWPHLPLTERVLDRLADILFASDEILDMISTNHQRFDDTTESIESRVRAVYAQVNELMQKLAD